MGAGGPLEGVTGVVIRNSRSADSGPGADDTGPCGAAAALAPESRAGLTGIGNITRCLSRRGWQVARTLGALAVLGPAGLASAADRGLTVNAAAAELPSVARFESQIRAGGPQPQGWVVAANDAQPSGDLVAVAAPATLSGRRVALVIGNGAYKHYPALRNPENDAEDMAARLRGLGFDVVERTNLTKDQIGATLREFKARMATASVALFFYAGHGMQIKGENYLPAVDAVINGEEDVPHQSLALNQVLDALGEAKTRLNLVFLDACRDNPFVRSTRSGSRGLARTSAPSGTLISYATRPGSVAADGSGRNGLFTSQLLRHMARAADVPIEQVLKLVLRGVKSGSDGEQEPWWEGSMEGDFCFGVCSGNSFAMRPADNAPASTASADVAPAPTAMATTPKSAASPPKAPEPSKPTQLAKVSPAKQTPPAAAEVPAAAARSAIEVSVTALEPLYFTRAFSRSDTGRIYRLADAQASEQYARLPAGNKGIFSVAESPGGELYFCDATEPRIFKIEAGREVVLYKHSGLVKHLAFDPSGRLYFSSVAGSRNDGVIYRLDGKEATPVYSVKLEQLGGNWSGTFAFDQLGKLWLSTGARMPASLYRVESNQYVKVFTTQVSGIMGFLFLADGSIAYADNASSVMRLTLPDLQLTRLFESPYEGWLTDVKLASTNKK